MLTEQEKMKLTKQFFDCIQYLTKEDAEKIKDILVDVLLNQMHSALEDILARMDDCK